MGFVEEVSAEFILVIGFAWGGLRAPQGLEAGAASPVLIRVSVLAAPATAYIISL